MVKKQLCNVFKKSSPSWRGGEESSGCSRQLFITDLLWMRCVTALRQFKTSVQNSHKVCCVALTCETSPKPQKCGLEPEGHKCIYGHLSLLKVYSNTLSIIKIIYLLHLMVNNIIVFYRLKPKPKQKKILTGNTCYKCLINFFLSMRKLTSKQTYENIIIWHSFKLKMINILFS